MTGLAARGAALLGGSVASATNLGGGSLSALVQLALTDGRQAIVKTCPSPRTEAAMLQAIAATGAPAPEVLAVDDTVLVLSVMENTGRLSAAWEDLGRVLAKLHAAIGARYGWPEDYAFGPVTIVNTPNKKWPDFWAQNRLLNNAPFVGNALARRLEHLAADLPNRLPQAPKPSLLHGDLWGGNILTANGKITALIDPACYYGDGLVDIAMLEMFDHPPAAFYSAYGISRATDREAIDIYRLWPALVHLRLFGDGYRPLVEGLLSGLGV